jgi:hypothetical protein
MYDKLETVYGLAPDGWTEIEDRYFGRIQGTPKPVPTGCVEKWERCETQASEWSRAYVDWKCVWADESVSRAERDALRQKFPIPENPARQGLTIGNPL